MSSVAFLVPGDLSTRTGGYEYDRHIIDGLRRLRWSVDVRQLDGNFPAPTPSSLRGADAVLASVADGAVAIVDGLALGAMPDVARRHAGRLRLVALVHHPLAWETGLPAATAERLLASERAALAVAQLVVVTSPATAAGLGEFGVPAERIAVVEPGTEPAPLARGSQAGGVHLLCVASVSARKGHGVLLRALAGLRSRRWQLTCVGDLSRDRQTAAEVAVLIREYGLEEQVVMPGEADADQIAALYDRSDVFVLPTLYEGYGMAVAEALARGLPVISTPTGAIASLVTDDAGLLVAAGDVDGWRSALAAMFDDEARAAFARGARERRATLPTWEEASERMALTLSRLG